MSQPEPIRIIVDLTNPGQFFACCGLGPWLRGISEWEPPQTTAETQGANP
jgi:hypothetical protein